MTYKSKAVWRDLEDGHLYAIGEDFPHDGREIPEERIKELTGTQNKAGFALLEAVELPDKETIIHTEEEPKKPTRGRRKAK